GPRQSMRAVIPTIILQALRTGAIEIGSTSPTRDFNYVKDIARGFALAGSARDIEGEGFNLGTGVEHSIRDVIEMVATILDIELAVSEKIDRVRPEGSEVHRLLADSGKAAAHLGWSPHYTFREGLEEAIEWYETWEHNIAQVHAL